MNSLQGLSPALIIIVGALAVPLLRGQLRNIYMLALPVIAFVALLSTPDGDHGTLQYLGLELVTIRIDNWSRIFSYIFLLATAMSIVYAWHIRDWVQQIAGLVYAGGAVGAVLAGDFVTLFVYWEVTAVSSVFLVWATRTEASYRSGMRYVTVQLISGLLLLTGALVLYSQSGSIRFDHVGLNGLGGWLIFLAFGIKCAFPLLHNWLQDAYPQATVTGTVFLSAFTTKLAIYALARGFAGTPELIWIGAPMTAFPIFYAVIENDLRRVLAYSLNNQLGFMVVGIGVGTELALNGTAAHAFCHIIYKALLFMSMGAVLLRAGTVNGSALGGLYKSMPWTAGFCMVGAASISAFPLFSGFVSKSLIITAVALEGHFWVWAILLFASAGVFHHSGIKIPYFAFFAHDSGIRCKEAPPNMLIAMGVASALCIGIGVYPSALYSLLPYAVDYQPYTPAHVLTQLQLLVFSALAFSVLMWYRIYPPELASVNVDSDYFYRRVGPAVARGLGRVITASQAAITQTALAVGAALSRVSARQFSDGSVMVSGLSAQMLALAVGSLAIVLLFVYGMLT
ncbi:MAG: Na(+)/H(+) antiporter subunit D [Chromatiales bacterium]|nr:Na(+)/H(+) antiporter subunit D [Chromatiales bacterium]